MRQKGSILLYIIIAAVVVALLSAGFYFIRTFTATSTSKPESVSTFNAPSDFSSEEGVQEGTGSGTHPVPPGGLPDMTPKKTAPQPST